MSRNLSDYWRIDRSDDHNTEMASILSGATNAVNLLGGRYGVQWAGESIFVRNRRMIGLDADLLAGFKAPIPGQAVDIIIGMAIHNTGRGQWTLPIEGYEAWPRLNRDERTELRGVHHILEDVYVAVRLKKLSTTLFEYLRAFRRAVYRPGTYVGGRIAAGAVQRRALVELWTAVCLYNEKMTTVPSELAAALENLQARTRHYTLEDDPRARMILAADVWQWLQRFPHDPGTGSLMGLDIVPALPDDTVVIQIRQPTSGGSGGGSLQDLSQFLNKPPNPDTRPQPFMPTTRVDESNARDLTQELSQAGISGCLTRIQNGTYDAAAHREIKVLVATEIRQVHRLFARFELLESRWRHGLTEGKLDGPRLSKAGAGKTTVFKRRDVRDKSSMGVILLMDVSASMDMFMVHANKAACIFAEALRPLYPRLWYEVITYTGDGLHAGADVQLSRLASSTMRLSLKNIWLHGGTPTAEAIAAAMLMLKKRRKHRSVIIHFTDGHPKDARKVRQVLARCRQEDVDVLTISVKISQKNIYGPGKSEVIDAVPALPGAITRMVKSLYG